MSAYYLDTPTLRDLDDLRRWRMDCPQSLRTPRAITPLEQDAFYRDVICNRQSPHRYYAVRDHELRLHQATVSLENISPENGHAELGLIVCTAFQGKGIGRAAVALALEVAFGQLRLVTVWLECYFSGHPQFWLKVLDDYHGSHVIWPRRKFWDGALHDAILGTITRDGWQEAQRCGSSSASASV